MDGAAGQTEATTTNARIAQLLETLADEVSEIGAIEVHWTRETGRVVSYDDYISYARVVTRLVDGLRKEVEA